MPNPELSQRIRALPEELLGLEREPGTAECLRRIDALKGRARALEPLDGVEEMALSDYDRDWLVRLLDAIADNAGELVKGADATFANRVHAVTEPKPERRPKADAKTDSGPAAPAAAAPAEPPPKNAMAAMPKEALMRNRRRRFATLSER